ncbi:MAG: GTP cyclohydrolase II [Planctomycetota bacterium]
MEQNYSTVPEAVDAIARGEVVIVMDAEDRENEGDFVCAAELATTETVNFILNGRGEFCVAVLPDVCQRLGLSPLVDTNTAPLGTGFMTPIDHRSVKTGITAEERALTVRAIANSSSVARDFVRPGHVHPLLAKEGGVLRRAGHTEATVDLVRMAGCSPAGVLGEILNSAGDRATPQELFALAAQHNLKIITIEQLIRHRRVSEKLVSRVAEAKLPTRYGDFQIVVYQVRYEEQQPMALVFGNPAEAAAPLVRLHSSCFTGDLVESLRCDCGDQFHEALEMISSAGAGALIYLPQEGRGIGLVEKIKAYALQEQGLDTVEANLALGHKADSRDYGVGMQILKDLGLSHVRLLTNNPKKTDAFIYGGFNLSVVDQVPITVPANQHNAQYLATKRDKLGHRLPGQLD